MPATTDVSYVCVYVDECMSEIVFVWIEASKLLTDKNFNLCSWSSFYAQCFCLFAHGCIYIIVCLIHLLIRCIVAETM